VPQLQYLMRLHSASSVLDYGSGKGLQYALPGYSYRLPDGTQSQPAPLDQHIGADSVTLYDPGVPGIDTLPSEHFKCDAIICTQVLGNIADQDLSWVRDLWASWATKFVFVGMSSLDRVAKPSKIPALKGFAVTRTIDWYLSQFAQWQGPSLYWYWEHTDHPANSWYVSRPCATEADHWAT
jgi:hypothetical protein